MSSGIAREATLAFGLVVLLLGSMWVATGSFPPMVVVESGSMMHEDEGSLGAIDPGDLVLVLNTERADIVTFAEATEPGNENFGYESHGMEGDVIIYVKNGLDSYTPVIHRALLKAIVNSSGGWDVPGTTLRNVDSISWTLDYSCESYHGNTYNLSIENWTPLHEGYLTVGDNNDCMIDQPSANQPQQGSGFFVAGEPVQAVKEEWIRGIASTEIPWLGAAKLVISNTSNQVTQTTWRSLIGVIAVIISVPYLLEIVIERREKSTEEE